MGFVFVYVVGMLLFMFIVFFLVDVIFVRDYLVLGGLCFL